MRILLPFIIVFLMIPGALALEECQRQTRQADIPCAVISTWRGSTGNCADYTNTFYNSTPTNISSVAWTNYTPFCQATFNFTTQGTYTYNGTLETGAITVVADIGFGGPLLFFFVVINLFMFIFPFFVSFVSSPKWDHLIRKSIWVAGLMFLTLNTTMALQLSDQAGLNVNSIILTYHYLFVRGIYIAVLILMIQAFFSFVKEWGGERKEKQMGGM